MNYWKTDEELFELIRNELFTALVGDVLDTLGCYHQFLPQAIKPLDPEMRIIGRAMTVLECDVYSDTSISCKTSDLGKQFGLMFQALDDLKENEIYICTGSSLTYALWGGLMSSRALQLKASGAILNGYSRDTQEILNSGLPVFSMGSYAQDQGVRGKVVDFRVPIEIDKVRIEPGDLIFGDRDGVIVVPKKLENEVFKLALEKGREEKKVLKAIEGGMSTVDAFIKFGIM